MAPRFAVVLRTNLTSMNNVDDFLKNTAQYLGKRLDTSVKNITLEVQCGVSILRNGSTEPACNVDVHHNTDDVNKTTKIAIAEDVADFFNKELNVKMDRTLVLFFDTRKCT